ncbi:MAG TPA: ATP-grasp domain-containing protein [Jatrophihabitans sp.]|nr:ATP-grasp domain-containing protein [Jatrophihabitans sp.]
MDHQPASGTFHYDGVFFGSPDSPAEHAIGHYHQDGDLVTVEISGGGVRAGRLVGSVDAAGVIEAGYVQAMQDGVVVAGRVSSSPSRLPDGRILLTERWTRMDGSSGVSTIVSLAQPHAPSGADSPEIEMRNSIMPTDAADRPHLLLISTGDRLFREYLLAPIAEHYRIHLFLAAEPTWESQYLDGVTVLPDTMDAAAMIAAAAELDARDHLDGVLCWDEARIVAAAAVAQSLGLPGGDPEMVLRCRDKHLTRELAEAAGVPQPRSVLVGSADEAAQVAAGIGYPVVLKPRGVAASLGVVLVRTEQELRDRFAFARDTTAPGAITGEQIVLVEEYADGPEISVDCAVHHGEVMPICLAHKQVGYEPYFEEVGHLVDGAEPMLSDPAFLDVLHRTHRALGFTDGITHSEFRLTATGPKLIEVNARLGGDLIPYLGLRATGIDPGLAAAAVAVGRRPELTPDRKAVGAVRFCYVPHELTVATIGFEGSRMPAGVDLAVVRAQPGSRQFPPPKGSTFGRIAYITALADTEAEVRAIITAAESALVVTEATAVDAALSGEPLS